jgi:hypothetical protein
MDILSALHNPDITCVCRVTGVTGHCDTCGAVVIGLHMPDVAHGWYCAEHCPCREYRPGADEIRAIEANRARVLGSRGSGLLSIFLLLTERNISAFHLQFSIDNACSAQA